MKKIVVCNIPMIEKKTAVYLSEDKTIPASGNPVLYPINAFLEETMKPDDEISVLLLTKNGMDNFGTQNITIFKNELNRANESIGAKITFKEINTDFSQEKSVHEKLLFSIVDEIEPEAHIYADITHGSKDMPIVVFTAFNFAERFMNCSIENIVYGQAKAFDHGVALDTYICDMSPLYYLSSISNVIQGTDPSQAKNLLNTLLSL